MPSPKVEPPHYRPVGVLHYYPVGVTTPLCGKVGMEPRKGWKCGRHADLCPQCRSAHIKLWLNREKK